MLQQYPCSHHSPRPVDKYRRVQQLALAPVWAQDHCSPPSQQLMFSSSSTWLWDSQPLMFFTTEDPYSIVPARWGTVTLMIQSEHTGLRKGQGRVRIRRPTTKFIFSLTHSSVKFYVLNVYKSNDRHLYRYTVVHVRVKLKARHCNINNANENFFQIQNTSCVWIRSRYWLCVKNSVQSQWEICIIICSC